MNAFLNARRLMLRAILLCAAAFAACALFLSSSPVSAGSAGQAVALRAALNPAGTRTLLQTDVSTPSGRFVYDPKAPQYALPSGKPLRTSDLRRRSLAALTNPVQIAEPTQTYDVFLPPPAFAPTNGLLTPVNQTPVWTADERYLVFARQVTDADGVVRSHLFSIAAKGDAPGAASSLHQITTGPGNESFPTLNPVSNNQFAFVSTAGNGTPNLYVLPTAFSPSQTTVDVSTLTSLTIRTDLQTGFDIVARPTWEPTGTRIAFSARDTAAPYAGIYHIYYLYLTSGGGLSGSPSADNPPAKFTDGPANDADPAWTPDGNFIAFDSTASSISSSSTTTLTVTGTPTTSRSIFLINNQGGGGVKLTNSTVTTGGSDDLSPAWNAGTNYAGLLTFARSPNGPGNHDIFYYQAYTNPSGTPVIATDAAAQNTEVQLDTDDNPDPSTGAGGNVYDDVYPTFAPFTSVFSVAYQSNRTVTYNAADTTASETALSIPRGGTGAFGVTVGAGYEGLLVSRLFQIDAPTLLPYTPGEVVHVTDSKGIVRRNGDIAAGAPVTFTVRLSSREAGNDDGNIYLQIKDPDSKYQDAQGLEHKVFTQDVTDNLNLNSASGGLSPSNNDSGSATNYLYNGGALKTTGVNGNHNATQNFKPKSHPNGEDLELRGAVGGFDGTTALALGYNGGGTNPIRITTTVNNAPFNSILPGGNPLNFSTFGQEYECQYVNAQFAQNGTTDTQLTDYGTPYYLAGVDDQGFFSAPTPRPEWLKLSRATVQDGLGGVLYTATWATPTSRSDYYLDVIAYDKVRNWRIYDNVWGFSTQPFTGSADILVVSDNALGQKFVGTTFGDTGLFNIPPIFYGSESYFTDIDIAKLPNAIFRYFQPTGLKPHDTVTNQDIAADDDPVVEIIPLEGTLQQDGNPSPVFNGLGVNSYAGDPDIEQSTVIGGVSVARSQQYSLWRILSRGPVDPNVLAAYSPAFNVQPAVKDIQAGFTAPAADGTTVPKVPDAHRCVVWTSPYTGDLPLNVSGSLADAQTQLLLRAFVLGGQYRGVTLPGGGRLFVSGQDVASALTQDGTVPVLNTKGSFLTDVLNASLVTPSATAIDPGNEGNQNFTVSAGRLAGDAYFNPGTNGQIQDFFTKETADNTYFYTTPSSLPFLLGNNYVEVGSGGLWRTDGSLTQLGPKLTSFGGVNVAESQIDIVVPQNGAHTEAKFAGPGGGGTAASATGVPGLIYNENLTTGQGRVVYASFGLEGLGIEYYKYTDTGKVDHYHPYNQRPNVLHNIVSYLRTGTVTGTILAANSGGQGVPGATVYLVPNGGAAFPGNRQTFSALTGSDGTFRIDGVEPGVYYAVSYKAGYNRAESSSTQSIDGDTSAAFSLNLTAVVPGSLSGTVTDAATGKGINKATVFFDDGAGSTFSTQTDASGNYVVASAPPSTYTGTASATGYATSMAKTGIVVSSNINTVVNFQLSSSPATITVHVVDSATNLGLAGAVVAVTPPAGASAVPSQTTDASGNVTFSTLSATPVTGTTYTLTATLNSYAPGTATQTVTPGQSVSLTIPLTLIPPPANGTLGGIVYDSALNTPLTGATVSVSVTGTTTPVQTATTGASSSPAAPTGDGAPLNYSFTLPPGTYDVTVSKTGFGSKTLTGFVVKSTAFTRADFVDANALQGLHVFPAGYNFFSVPYDYTGAGLTFDTVFGVLNQGSFTATPPTVVPSNANRSHAYVWQPQLLQYILDPTPPADTLRIGQGYWIYLNSPAELVVPGTTPSGATVSVALRTGWNMIGVPSTSAVPVSNLAIARTGASSITFADASSDAYRILQGTLYTYPAGAAKGTPYTSLTSSGSLEPYQAYWIYAYVDTTLLIPTSSTAIASARQNTTPISSSSASRISTVRARGRTF